MYVKAILITHLLLLVLNIVKLYTLQVAFAKDISLAAADQLFSIVVRRW